MSKKEQENWERVGWKCFVYIICGWLTGWLVGSLLYLSQILYFYYVNGSWDWNWEHFSTLNKEKKPLSSLNEWENERRHSTHKKKEQKENILNNITWLLNIFQCYVIICLMKLFSFSCQEKKSSLVTTLRWLMYFVEDDNGWRGVGIAYFYYRWMDFSVNFHGWIREVNCIIDGNFDEIIGSFWLAGLESLLHGMVAYNI